MSTTVTTPVPYGGICGSGSVMGRASVLPDKNIIVCSGGVNGTALVCADGGPAAATTVKFTNPHVEHGGRGLFVTGTQTSANIDTLTCSSSKTVGGCIEIDSVNRPPSVQVLNAVSGTGLYPVLIDDNNGFTYTNLAGLPYYLGGTASATYGATVLNADPVNSQTLTALAPSWGTGKYTVSFARSSTACGVGMNPCWLVNGVVTAATATMAQTVNLYSARRTIRFCECRPRP
jgi:hypothetical protein